MVKNKTRTAIVAVMITTAIGGEACPLARADPSGNNQGTYELCKDPDYARLHVMVCDGHPFELAPSVGHGGGRSGGLLGGILGSLGRLL